MSETMVYGWQVVIGLGIVCVTVCFVMWLASKEKE